MKAEPCPLCGADAVSAGWALSRLLYTCPICDLRFISSACHLSADQEYTRYLLHQNSLSNSGYVKFLMLAVESLVARLPQDSGVPPTILDYGSGPTPVLVHLLNKAGFDAMGYDPFFGNALDQEVVVTSSLAGQGPFDAVVSTETVEHFRRPEAEWGKMISLVRPGGYLVVITSFVLPGVNLTSWYYAHDPTHIAFYSESTWAYIAEKWGLALLETNGRNLVVMRKPLPL